MRFLILFVGQGLNFLIAVVNIRAASRGYVGMTMATDFVFCAVNFTLIQRVAVAGNSGELLAYSAGGALGSALAILCTRRWDRP